VARVLLAIVAIALMSGCECLAAGPRLGRSAGGGMAIGWELEGSEVVHRVRLEQQGVVRWQIDATDGTPRVIDVGLPAGGFRTTKPFDPPLDANAEASVVVDFTDDRGVERSTGLVYRSCDVDKLGRATVADYRCGLDLGAIASGLGRLMFGAVLFGLLVLIGVTGLLFAVRRAVRGAPLDP